MLAQACVIDEFQEFHNSIAAEYMTMSEQLDVDTAGNHEVGDALIKLLDSYCEIFHCSRSTAYDRIAKNVCVLT